MKDITETLVEKLCEASKRVGAIEEAVKWEDMRRHMRDVYAVLLDESVDMGGLTTEYMISALRDEVKNHYARRKELSKLADDNNNLRELKSALEHKIKEMTAQFEEIRETLNSSDTSAEKLVNVRTIVTNAVGA
jgi:uncharacterized protein YlxW (UPF0749 family)